MSLIHFVIPQNQNDKISNDYLAADIHCGWCKKDSKARIIVSEHMGNSVYQAVTYCSCGRFSVVHGTFWGDPRQVLSLQYPVHGDYNSKAIWPAEISDIYNESALCYSSGAFTASALMSRKGLMNIACEHGAEEGKSFALYVDYITTNVIKMDRAKHFIDRIRTIGNDATHHVEFVTKEKAAEALNVLTYICTSVYDVPNPP